MSPERIQQLKQFGINSPAELEEMRKMRRGGGGRPGGGRPAGRAGQAGN